MAKIGFLSHSDLSIALFRAPIMRALQKKGHEVFAIAPKGIMTQQIESEFKSVTYEIDKASLNPLKIFKDSSDLASVLKELNLDMLQTSAHKSNVFGTIAAKRAGVPIVLNLIEGLGSFYTNSDLKSKLVKFVMESLYKKTLNLSNATIFVNDSDPDYLLSKNIIKKEKVIRIKSVGIDSGEFDPENVTPYDYGSDKKIVLMIGRALFDKGIREFYEAAEILKGRDDAQFVFVGDTYEGNKSSAAKEFLQSPNVRWISWSDKIKELLKGAYIYVLPSYKEGFPRTVLEAMSMEKACVVSRCDGCVEAIQEGINGLICEVRDSKDLAKKIEILLDDESLAKKMGKAGRQMVLEHYDEKIVVEKYLEVYRKFIDV
ncbi:MAG: glycosyltransferase family 4 protein [Campylobacteraceae bacterium]|nr:glycosyltransferase family 4 protein [Campylobacteraceae bacterium]